MAKILVIEDQEEMRVLVEETLLAAGHQVFMAEDGKQGLKLLRAEAMDLIITDIYMPEMEGLEFLRILREEGSKVPIIAMSGNPDLQIALAIARRLGAVATLTKPFRREELRTAVTRALGGRTNLTG